MLSDVEVDHLVGNDSHSLKGKGLNTSSWESLDNPALSLLFMLHDLFLDKLDHDLIIDC